MRAIERIVDEAIALRNIEIYRESDGGRRKASAVESRTRNLLIAKLVAAPYTVEHIRQAAESWYRIIDLPHTRPLDWAYWLQALNEPTYSSHDVALRVQRASIEAYRQGRTAGYQEAKYLFRPTEENAILHDPKEYIKALQVDATIKDRIATAEKKADQAEIELQKSEEKNATLMAENQMLRHTKKLIEERYQRLLKHVPTDIRKRIEEEEKQRSAA